MSPLGRISAKHEEELLLKEAAAPEMYDALKAMVDRWEPDCIGTDRVMWENAVFALAKARGES